MKPTVQILCDILKVGMGLKSDQIWIYNQRRHIPEDQGMYVVVGMLSSKIYGNTLRNESVPGNFIDHTTIYMSEQLTVDLFSYTTEALERYPEALAALNNTYSEQQQELLGFKIGMVPQSVSDVSEVDGDARLFRMNITLNVWRKYDKLIDSQYYDQFSTEPVLTNE